MSLLEHTLFGVTDKVQKAIDRLRAFEPPDGYFLAFSGGKDSQCIYHLAKEAGVQFEAHFHMTSVDPPEVISFVREYYPDVIMDKPPESMWRLIERKKIPPTRKIRYCCGVYKERGGIGRTVVTGVRWAESARRKATRAMLELNAYSKKKIMLNNDNDEARRMFETCQLKGKHIVNPIIDFTTDDVWEYLNSNNLPHCCLYDEGFHRIGCIGCPMSREKGMLREFARWPKYHAAYMRAFDRMLINRRQSGLDCSFWPDAQAVMDWWIYGLNCQVKCNDLLKKTSCGVFHPRHLRGLKFSFATKQAMSSSEESAISNDFGKYSRSNPLVFSLVPRCHGA